MTPRYRLYGVEIVPSIFGAGFDVIRHTPAMEDEQDEHVIVGTKGMLDEAIADAREHHRIQFNVWRAGERGPAPFLLLWPREVVDDRA